MNLKEYSVSIENKTIVLINTKTASEGGRFETKTEAFKQLMEMLMENHISTKHALDLFEEVLKSNVPFEKTDFTLHPHKIFKSQLGSVADAAVKYRILEELCIMESVTEPCLKICQNCKDHGTIYIPNIKTGPVYSKFEGFAYLEILYKENIINLIDKERLMKELEESNIPYQSEETLTENN